MSIFKTLAQMAFRYNSLPAFFLSRELISFEHLDSMTTVANTSDTGRQVARKRFDDESNETSMVRGGVLQFGTKTIIW